MQHPYQEMSASEVILGTPIKQQPLELQGALKNSNDDGAVHGQPSLQSNSLSSSPAKITTPLSSLDRADLDAARPSPLGTPVPYDSDNIEPKDNEDTTVAPTTKAAHGRKPSLTDAVLATATTAATNAASAASTVVSAAMKLVSHDGSDDDLETAEAASERVGRTGTGILPGLMKSSQDDHQGLEFSQRRLSIDRSKKAPTERASNSVTGKNGFGETGASAVADSSFSELGQDTSNLKISGVETVSTGVGTTAAALPAAAIASSSDNSSTPAIVTETPLETKVLLPDSLYSFIKYRFFAWLRCVD